MKYIPFSVSKSEALETLQSQLNNRPFLPAGFSIENNIGEIEKTYIPCIIFNGKAQFKVTFDAQKLETPAAQRVPVMKHYDLEREGEIDFSETPLFVSNIVPSEVIMTSGVIDFTKTVESENLDNGEITAEAVTEDSEIKIKSELENAVKNLLYKELKDFQKLNVKDNKFEVNIVSDEKKTVYVPFWVINSKWNDQNCVSVINGQNGILSGTFPVDKKKYRSLFFKIAVPVAIGITMIMLKLLMG